MRWTAPAGCPDQARVQSQIDALLGRPLRPEELKMQGTIESTASGWRLTLTTRVGTLVDERSLDANDCSVLADAAALVAVVMLDPVQAADTIEAEAAAAEEARTEADGSRPPEAPTIPEPTPEPPRESEPERPRRAEPPWVAMRLRAGGEYGAVPGGTGAFDLGIALAGLGRAGRLRAELVGLYAIGRGASSRGVRTRVHLGSFAPRFCAALPAGPVEIPLCGGLELGAMRADTAGSTTNGLWVAAHAEPGVRWAFAERVSLWASAQVVIPVRYPNFGLVVDQTVGNRFERVYEPSPVAARGLVGLEFRLSGSANR